jgi:hypothetical protein
MWMGRAAWLVAPYYLVSDADFLVTPELIQPFGRTDTPTHAEKTAFNRALYPAQRVIACAFAILKNRFRILLHGGLRRGDVATLSKWIHAPCILHNMCINAGDTTAPAVEPDRDTDTDTEEDDESEEEEGEELYDVGYDDCLEVLPGGQFGYAAVIDSGDEVIQGRLRRLQACSALGLGVFALQEECDKAGCTPMWAAMNPLA